MKDESKRPTTIKISGDLRRKIEKTKADSIPLTTYVREAIEQDLKRKQSELSGKAYRDFIAHHPKEAEWLKQWEMAQLETPPHSSPSKKGKSP